MILITCPHCSQLVEIEQVNCSIFRHGVFKENGEQVHPHAPKVSCLQWIVEDKIYGCCKPFRLNQKIDGSYVAEKCDYI